MNPVELLLFFRFCAYNNTNCTLLHVCSDLCVQNYVFRTVQSNCVQNQKSCSKKYVVVKTFI